MSDGNNTEIAATRSCRCGECKRHERPAFWSASFFNQTHCLLLFTYLLHAPGHASKCCFLHIDGPILKTQMTCSGSSRSSDLPEHVLSSGGHVLLNKAQGLLLDMRHRDCITMLLFVLQVPLEQELHLLGRQMKMRCPLKQCLNTLLLSQSDFL